MRYFCLFLLVVGCGGTSEVDAGSDAGRASDAGAVDGGSDAGMIATDDGGADAGPFDAGPFAMCPYFSIEERVVECSGDFVFVGRFITEEGAPPCPEFYGFSEDGAHYASFEQAIAANSACDDTCVYRFVNGVSRLYCGRRHGYETLEADGCPMLFRIDGEYYESIEEYDRTHPCE
jgi:hypothetical protein